MTTISGDQIVAMMHRQHVSIRQVAEAMGVSQRRVREVRRDGAKGRCMVIGWVEAIVVKAKAK